MPLVKCLIAPADLRLGLRLGSSWGNIVLWGGLGQMDFGESEIVQILHDHAVDCAENGHIDCRSTLRCQKLAAEYAEKVAADVRARAFDIQVAEAPWLDRQPSIDTPVAALMRIVQRNLTVGPFGYDNFRRSVRTTTALARLGELDIPPDAVVRTGLRQRIIQSII